ncbi:Uncharacterised protein [Vibrio cholerae]|nr:Uncharacterised protein [Vibrio cholerae]
MHMAISQADGTPNSKAKSNTEQVNTKVLKI